MYKFDKRRKKIHTKDKATTSFYEFGIPQAHHLLANLILTLKNHDQNYIEFYFCNHKLLLIIFGWLFTVNKNWEVNLLTSKTFCLICKPAVLRRFDFNLNVYS